MSQTWKNPRYPITRNIARRKLSSEKKRSGRRHFAKFCKKSLVNQVEGMYEFLLCQKKSLGSLMKYDEQKDNEDFRVFEFSRVIDKERK